MIFSFFDLLTPGVVKGALKGLDAVGLPCKGAVEVMEEITSCPAYTKQRIDNATDKVQGLWDDHKEDVSDFFDNVGDSIQDGWDSITETISDNADDIIEGIGDFLGGLFG